jgi:hypothetical protein
VKAQFIFRYRFCLLTRARRRAQLLQCRPQIRARGEPRKADGARCLLFSPGRGCPPETAWREATARCLLPDRRRCVHVLAA